MAYSLILMQTSFWQVARSAERTVVCRVATAVQCSSKGRQSQVRFPAKDEFVDVVCFRGTIVPKFAAMAMLNLVSLLLSFLNAGSR